MSSPAWRMLRPGSGSPTSTSSPAIDVRSTGTTVAVPSGTTAPVEILIAAAAGSACPNGWPARDSPTTGSTPEPPGATAKPSIAELVERRHVDRAGHVLGQHAVQGGGQVELLRLERDRRRKQRVAVPRKSG